MKTLFIAILSLLVTHCFAQDMQLYLTKTQQMVREKNYPEALERFIWFHNHALENDKAMVGVRLSFALSYWKSLANVYPPALTALQTIRNNKTKAIVDSNGTTQFFADVVALNRTLKENNNSIVLFETIEKQDSNKAKLCWLWIKREVMNAKKYDIAKKYISTPLNEFAQIKNLYEISSSFRKEDSIKGGQFNILDDNRFAQQCLQLIDYSIAINDSKSAKEIQKLAIVVVNDKRLGEVKIE